MKSDLVDLELHVHHQTPNAVLVSDDGERANAVWLPLSACEVEWGGGSATVTLSEKLAIEKGLV